MFALCGGESRAIDAPGLHAPYEIPGSEVRTLRSVRLGRSYDIYVKLPPGYGDAANAERQYPVIYLNDGTYAFQTASGVTHAPMGHGGFEHAILVGLSYAKGEDGAISRRRDFTPTKNPAYPKGTTGGARDYLTFLRDGVIPFVEREYRADPARRVLAGQSYGGLFGAYALFAEPGLFQSYLLTSPSLWFHNLAIFDMEEEFARLHDALPAQVYFAIGETETPAINGGKNDMVGQQRRFIELLRKRGYEGLVVRDEVIGGGTHLTTFPIGLTRGLMWIIPGPTPYGG